MSSLSVARRRKSGVARDRFIFFSSPHPKRSCCCGIGILRCSSALKSRASSRGILEVSLPTYCSRLLRQRLN
ncbi:hypothetical protein BDZ89DRAFT_786710 [Hymenopellis radicata]|nr:hypothetical protein BDZ89DRAFT_786710 [Hymenopellis radicata]